MRHRVTPLETAEAQGLVYAISDRDLASAFGLNSVQATTAYAGHRIRVTGPALRYRPDFGGHSSVELVGTNNVTVQSMLSIADYQMLAPHLPGGRLTLECTGHGMESGMVRLDDCVLEK